MARLTVEKIGGTSMSRFPEILENVILAPEAPVFGRIYVVSAYGGVTDQLLESKKTGEAGVYSLFARGGPYQDALKRLVERLLVINAELGPAGLPVEEADAFIRNRVDEVAGFLRSMSHAWGSGYVPRDSLLLAARELLAAVGEAHSAFNSALMVRARGCPSEFVDLSGVGDSSELTIDQRIAQALASVDPSRTIPFFTGYCKGTEGIMRAFDRGYSEVTFCKVAVQAKPAEAIIHKEYHLCSADPLVVGPDRAKPVCFTNFDVADQLADVGMEAIHPKASKPLELAGIPIRVKNAFDPAHQGTLFTKTYRSPDSRTEVIAGNDKVTWIEVHDPGMVGEVGFDLKIMEVVARFGVSYISKATNANTIGSLVLEKDVSDPLVEELRRKFDMVTVKPVSIACAIGSNIAKPGILALAAGALAEAGVNIVCVSQTSRQTNMQFIIERADLKTAIVALHDRLCG